MNSQQQQQHDHRWQGNKQLDQVVVEVRFGNPKFKDCRNFGICKMELIKDSSALFEKREQYAKAVIVKRISELEIFFLKDTLTEKTKEVYFKDGYFEIETQKIVKGAVNSRLGMNQFSLKPGKYITADLEKYLKIKIAI